MLKMKNLIKDLSKWLFVFALAMATALLFIPTVQAQENKTAANQVSKKETKTDVPKKSDETVKPIPTPVYTNYKGVTIGMTKNEARDILGKPKSKDKLQDYYAFTDKESAQIFYDKKGLVKAVSVLYINDENAPSPVEVLGQEVVAKANGSMYKMIRYRQAGYWIAYNRTAGDKPIITITMQKMQVRK